ncbi:MULTISPECIES: CysB family HTH-type transcriptional regulator [Caballeronia]|jgi:LysR family cys regulon transcriptional activator|uniref:Transcriptional regulator n=1 Tax=Caballeronia zhejiangensis TaxID=871203 RepID=A0A656QGG6_9BURK|nr:MULTISPECIES: CysB family HTH-type transcriptional regulator [Caballeronia]EKS68528.1 transcriptional regulator CysB-like protein [Burkholderia sp. SJ98]KDR28288.1 transcriptional regulator [Caballeronia zhejiangensis]MCG7404523.1 CysB family HTH-type transcriptional regulator [Caballeronia zhejiangensis]MCI1046409.1 CysB family HTH-type transcriptional regulator [Caballeronia zhejiangensis]MDR5764392.1 CysB family HTH-type transcriptional regulator [Caballeronia sp. LZ028]
MNLHQFRFVREAVRQNFNLTEAAKALYTSQPGVSKAIIELEDELGVEIFTRHGKRVRSLTEPGRIILASVEKILQEVESLKRVGKDYAAQDQGNLVIAATHTQARYSLPSAIAEFKKRFPKVHLSILQGSPTQVAEMVIHDQADIAIATEAIANYKELVSLPCFQWQHLAVMLPDHPLLERKTLTLDDLAQFPIITYEASFAGRTKINQAFALRNLTPDIVLEAIDADVIKTYVELGLGVGILADIAFNPERDRHLRAMPVGHLFGTNVTRLALKQGAYLRSYVYTLVELLSPSLNRKLIEQALSGEHESYEL